MIDNFKDKLEWEVKIFMLCFIVFDESLDLIKIM